MIKIIGGKRYDTSTASRIAQHAEGSPKEPTYCIEVLYRKRGGEYFLHGSGGASSRYSRAEGNSGWAASERIMPLSYDEASKWAMTHMEKAAYDREFGTPPENAPTVMLSVRISAASKARLDRKAQELGVTRAKIIEDLIQTL